MKHIFKCKDCFDLLVDYLEESLEPETQEKLDRHFAACPSCLNFLKSYRACSEMAEQLQDQQVEIPEEVEDRLKSFLQKHM